MTIKEVFGLIKSHILTVLIFGVFLASLSFFSLIMTQKDYKASTDLLVTQNQSGFVDYYALSKSADFLTNILVSSVYSDKFLNELSLANGIPDGFLPNNKIDRMKTWEKSVRITRNPSLGIIHIEVFGKDQKEITQLSEAIIATITNQYALFLGKGQDLDIRVLNGPTWEKNPTIGQLAAVIAGGFFMGCFLAFVWIYYKQESVSTYEEENRVEMIE
jgi:capsular polysaccharide biosynthesis protein